MAISAAVPCATTASMNASLPGEVRSSSLKPSLFQLFT
ncbi:Uncharacterised protein [Mycobacteroides abscessus subsp. abscessus]|nr:Uncharacterised protein [Mycobacteroides abscessus subsp. abscessus]